jgi:hypothetical protein
VEAIAPPNIGTAIRQRRISFHPATESTPPGAISARSFAIYMVLFSFVSA